MVIIVKDVLFSERSLRKIFLHLVLNMEFSKILPSHPMTIPTLLILLESHSLSIKTPLCGNGAHYGYNCPLKVPIIPNLEPFNNQTIKELPPTVLSFDPKSEIVHDSPNNRVTIKTLISRQNFKSFMIFNNKIFVVKITGLLMKLTNEEEKRIEEDQAANARYWKIPACYDDDDDGYTFAITPNEPVNSLNMRDEHLDTILATESDEFIKSSIENLVPVPSEFEGESDDDQSFFDEDLPKEIYSNPLFDEELIPMKIDPHAFNVESDLIESLLNHDSSIISSSKIDSLFDEFAGELTLLKSIPPGIDETDCYPEEETNFIKRFLYDNSSPYYPMLPGIEDDDYDSERDIFILEDLLSNDSLSITKNESFHFDIPTFFRPPAKPPDGNTGILNVKMMGDISEQKGLETYQPSTECPMMIHGKNTPILDVPLFHFYPP
nr:hypothetical protein [Tanacetum cinerariifolium]